MRNSDITTTDINRYFTSWTVACQESGVENDRTREPKSDEKVLNDWGMVTRKLGHIPTMLEYLHNGKHGRNAFNRFGKWADIPEVFRMNYCESEDWQDVMDILEKESHKAKTNFGLKAGIRSDKLHAHPKLINKQIYGDPIDFRGLRHEPVNEQGVVFLFGMIARELDYLVEAIQVGFPDCEAKRKISKGQWQTVRIEFEYESKNFLDHRHDPMGCDVIVCWNHNWAGCPDNLEVLALSEVIKKL